MPRIVNTRLPTGQISRWLFRRLEIAIPIAEKRIHRTNRAALHNLWNCHYPRKIRRCSLALSTTTVKRRPTKMRTPFDKGWSEN